VETGRKSFRSNEKRGNSLQSRDSPFSVKKTGGQSASSRGGKKNARLQEKKDLGVSRTQRRLDETKKVSTKKGNALTCGISQMRRGKLPTKGWVWFCFIKGEKKLKKDVFRFKANYQRRNCKNCAKEEKKKTSVRETLP